MKISKYQQTFIDAITRARNGDKVILRHRCRGRRSVWIKKDVPFAIIEVKTAKDASFMDPND